MMETTYCCAESWLAPRLRPGMSVVFTNREKVFVVAHTCDTVTVVPHRWWMSWCWWPWLVWYNRRKRQRAG